MAPHSGKVCVIKILKLDVTFVGLAACRIQGWGRLQKPDYDYDYDYSVHKIIDYDYDYDYSGD